MACRPEGLLPVCGQCRRAMVDAGDGWRHTDGTPRCPQGTADAVRGLIRFVTGVALP
jgi:hypothetical protein